MHWRIFYYMWLRRIYEFLCVHSNPIWKCRNCRDYCPFHLTFREYLRPFWFSRSCVVVAYCNRRMRSSNVQGFASMVPTLYKEEEGCIVIGARAVQFLHYVPLYRNTQHYTTLNCSIKTRYAPEAHKINVKDHGCISFISWQTKIIKKNLFSGRFIRRLP